MFIVLLCGMGLSAVVCIIQVIIRKRCTKCVRSIYVHRLLFKAAVLQKLKKKTKKKLKLTVNTGQVVFSGEISY